MANAQLNRQRVHWHYTDRLTGDPTGHNSIKQDSGAAYRKSGMMIQEIRPVQICCVENSDHKDGQQVIFKLWLSALNI